MHIQINREKILFVQLMEVKMLILEQQSLILSILKTVHMGIVLQNLTIVNLMNQSSIMKMQ